MPHCTIRHLDVPNPFYTYCANHPHKNPQRLEIPIGPVYAGDSMGNREVIHPLADTEEHRLGHIQLLAQIPEQPSQEYPAGMSLDLSVILQLLEWKEQRALPGLDRIAAFNPTAAAAAIEASPFVRDQRKLIRVAHVAMASLRGEPIPEDLTEAVGLCLFCSARVKVAPPVKGHLVECDQCHGVLVAGHGCVLGGFESQYREQFGPSLQYPTQPPPCVLPGLEPGKVGRKQIPFQCIFCKVNLLDPVPGVVRRVMCPGCDQWLSPEETRMLTPGYWRQSKPMTPRGQKTPIGLVGFLIGIAIVIVIFTVTLIIATIYYGRP